MGTLPPPHSLFYNGSAARAALSHQTKDAKSTPRAPPSLSLSSLSLSLSLSVSVSFCLCLCLSLSLSQSAGEAEEEHEEEEEEEDEDNAMHENGDEDAEEEAEDEGSPRSRLFFKRPQHLRRLIKVKSKRILRATVTGDPTGAMRVRDYVKMPRTIQTIDKVSFTMGVVGLMAGGFEQTQVTRVRNAPTQSTHRL